MILSRDTFSPSFSAALFDAAGEVHALVVGKAHDLPTIIALVDDWRNLGGEASIIVGQVQAVVGVQ